MTNKLNNKSSHRAHKLQPSNSETLVLNKHKKGLEAHILEKQKEIAAKVIASVAYTQGEREMWHRNCKVFSQGIENLRTRVKADSIDAFESQCAQAYRKICRSLRYRPSTAEFEICRVLGRGGYGIVYQCRHKTTDLYYALKQVPKTKLRSKNSRLRMHTEKSALATLNSEFIVKLEATFQDTKYLYQLLEYLDGGNLLDWMHKLHRFNETDTKFYIAELVTAVETIHKFGYVHRDIKPDNIVLTSDGHLRLLDFGLAKYAPHAISLGHPPKGENNENTVSTKPHSEDLGCSTHSATNGGSADEEECTCCQIFEKAKISETYLHSNVKLYQPNAGLLATNCGTVMYTAPEVLRGDQYTNKVDWWSVGVIMFEALYGGIPFCGDPSAALTPARRHLQSARLVIDHKRTCPIPYDIPGAPNLSKEAIHLLQHLVCEPSIRFNANEIKAHPWFSDINWSFLSKSVAPFSKLTTKPQRSAPLDKNTLNEIQPPLRKPEVISDLVFVNYEFCRISHNSFQNAWHALQSSWKSEESSDHLNSE